MDHMDEMLEEYLRTLNCTTIDCFRSLFYVASNSQLDDISVKYENSSGLIKEWLHDDGVQANMVRWLGEELILIFLYHSFEKKIKELIQSRCPTWKDENIKLGRWDEIKKYIPNGVKNSNEYQQVNILRELVNCMKHAGIVNDKLFKLQPSFGDVGEEIEGDLGELYEKYKSCASFIIKRTYDYYKI
jgi:hypothetical protein